MIDYDAQRTPQQRFRRSVWATFICWVIIVFFAFGMPALGYERSKGDIAHWIAITGVLWVPVTIWFLKRKMRRELSAEEGKDDA